MNATRLLYDAAGHPAMDGDRTGTCRVCGEPGTGLAFGAWLRDTFTDHDKLQPGEIICHACQFAFVESSVLLQERLGRDKPQRMRNYSHIIVAGAWHVLSKAEKSRTRELLLATVFPELAVIADSGQKHIVFRARVNPAGGRRGYVQFEEQTLFVDPSELQAKLEVIEQLYAAFSKEEIATGKYAQHRVMKFGVALWQECENAVRGWRGNGIFDLALYLAQRSDDERDPGAGGKTAAADLAGNPAGPEAALHERVGAVREPGTVGGVHDEPPEVSQLTLF